MSRLSATNFSPLSFPAPFTSRSGNTGGLLVGLGRARPPRGLHLPSQTGVTNVRFGGTVPENRGHTHSQRLGLAFETKVSDVLDAIYDVDYRPHPAILYEDRGRLRRAIPDGILRIGRTLVVIEVKLSHTERAWWQLRKVYIPLLSRLTASDVKVIGVEICRNFDPDTKWPEPFEVITSLHKKAEGLGVLQWRL